MLFRAAKELERQSRLTFPYLPVILPYTGPTVGTKRRYSIMEYLDSHFAPATGTDEVARYNAIAISGLGLDSQVFMNEDFSSVRYYKNNCGLFHQLYKVICRIYATPVSSCVSERDFSALNRVVTRDRAGIGPKTMKEIIVVRLLVENLTLNFSASASKPFPSFEYMLLGQNDLGVTNSRSIN